MSDAFTPVKIAGMAKEQIKAELAASYAASKPINDSLVDVSLKIQALTAEVYRRAIMLQLPAVPMVRRRTVMEVGCTVHPNTGLPLVAQRLAKLKEEGVMVTEVSYDENTGKFSFLAKPEFEIITPTLNRDSATN